MVGGSLGLWCARGVAALVGAGCADPADLVPATVDGDPSLPRLELRDSVFHLRTFGDPTDPVVIFLHGGPGSSMFGLLPYAEHGLADDHFLVFWDQRGAGLSRRHAPSEIGWDGYLADLEALIEHFAADDAVTLFAYSFGGTYAAAYFDAHPEDVDAMILVSPAPLSGQLYARAPFIDASLSEGTADVLWSTQVLAQ